MTDLGLGLVLASEAGPGDDVADTSGGFDDQGVEQPADFVDGDRDQAVRGGGAGRCGGEERVSGDDEGGPAVPGPPTAVLVLVQAEARLGGLERLLDAPPPAGDGHQVVQRNRLG